MRRINPLLDIFSADATEVITVTIRARNTAFMVTHQNPLTSGGTWTQVQAPTAADPVDIRTFKMPAAGESFDILYQFSPPAFPGAQRYEITFAGKAGTSDGPNDVFKPAASSQTTLAYVFSIGAAGTFEHHVMMAAAAAAAPPPALAQGAVKKTGKKAAKATKGAKAAKKAGN